MGDVERTAADTVVRFFLLPYSHSQTLSFKAVGIKATDGVTRGHGNKVDHINEGGEPVDAEPLDDSPAELLAGHTVTPGVFSEGFVEAPGAGDGRTGVHRKEFVGGFHPLGLGFEQSPKTVGCGGVHDIRAHQTDAHIGAMQANSGINLNLYHG